MVTLKLSIFDLPNEILILIFGQLRPNDGLEAAHRKYSYYDPESPRFHEYWAETRAYACLRFICRRANTVITTLIYEHFVIRLNRISFEVIETIFYYRYGHIRAISVYDDGETMRSELWNQASDILGRGIGLCTNLRYLQCRGHHCLFPNRAWFPRVVKSTFPNMTSLSIDPYHMDASFAIQAFGRQLRALELYGWERKGRSYPLHLPKELPFLEEFTIYRGKPPLSHVQKILTRIGSTDPTARSRTHPLRTLNIINYTERYSLSDLLLVNDIGKHLTTLSITLYSPLLHPNSESANLHHLASVLSSCPHIHTLYVELRSWLMDLKSVPTSLRHLTIYSDRGFWGDLERTRRRLRSGPLRTLTFLGQIYPSIPDAHLGFMPGPAESGGKFERVSYDRWHWATGYRFIFPERITS